MTAKEELIKIIEEHPELVERIAELIATNTIEALKRDKVTFPQTNNRRG